MPRLGVPSPPIPRPRPSTPAANRPPLPRSTSPRHKHSTWRRFPACRSAAMKGRKRDERKAPGAYPQRLRPPSCGSGGLVVLLRLHRLNLRSAAIPWKGAPPADKLFIFQRFAPITAIPCELPEGRCPFHPGVGWVRDERRPRGVLSPRVPPTSPREALRPLLVIP